MEFQREASRGSKLNEIKQNCESERHGPRLLHIQVVEALSNKTSNNTSLGVRIRESKYLGCAKGANLSSRELVHELLVPSYGPLCL